MRHAEAAYGWAVPGLATAAAGTGGRGRAGVQRRVGLGVGQPAGPRGGAPADIQPDRFRAFTLDQPALEAGLAAAPKAGLQRARADAASIVLSLPAPDGGFQRFEV